MEQKSLATMERANFFKNYIEDKQWFLCEIGAQAEPTFLKSEMDIDYLDYVTREQSTQLLWPEDAEVIARIPETDILVSSDDYASYTDKKYDAIIANHVIEHVNDIIYWLQSLEKLLKEDGRVFLTIPDKKYTFVATSSLRYLIADVTRNSPTKASGCLAPVSSSASE